MLKKLKLISLSEEYKILLGNFFSLSVLQVLNYLLPLITLPYLIRVLGPEKYGLIAFGTAFLTYFQLFTDYGFNLSATKDISINRENNKKISEIFSSVMIIKVVEDFIYLLILNSVISILIGIASLCIIFYKFKVNFIIPKTKFMKEQIKESFYLFLSNFSINIYLNSNTVILGIFTNNTIVGYYSIAEKIIVALRSIAAVIFQTLYPYICKKMTNPKNIYRTFFKKIFIPISICFFCMGLLILIFSFEIIHLL